MNDAMSTALLAPLAASEPYAARRLRRGITEADRDIAAEVIRAYLDALDPAEVREQMLAAGHPNRTAMSVLAVIEGIRP